MRRLAPYLVLAALLAGCAAQQAEIKPVPPPKPEIQTAIVLLPDASGRTGTVTVTAPGGSTVLDKPYATAEVTTKGEIASRVLDAGEVRRRFGAALDAQPPRPVSFTLYFEGKDELTAESRQALEQVKTTLAGWPAPEISVIGHTDRVGTEAANDALSLQRAEKVKTFLVQNGVSGERIEAVGRGEREPMVATADETAEPRNRRVEVSIR